MSTLDSFQQKSSCLYPSHMSLRKHSSAKIVRITLHECSLSTQPELQIDQFWQGVAHVWLNPWDRLSVTFSHPFVSLAYIHIIDTYLYTAQTDHIKHTSYCFFPILPFPPYTPLIPYSYILVYSSNTTSLSCHIGDPTVSVLLVLFFLCILVLSIPDYGIGFHFFFLTTTTLVARRVDLVWLDYGNTAR
jgi:hypothetical protein